MKKNKTHKFVSSGVAFILLCVLSLSVSAQAYLEIGSDGWGGGIRYAKPAVADIDGDGLLDMLVGDGYGKVHHFEQGIAGDTSFYKISGNFNGINTGSHAAPTFTDLDGDGLLDLIIGKGDGMLQHYEQNAANSHEFSLVDDYFNSIDIGSNATPAFEDIDNDGLLDLLIGEYSGNLNHYKQNDANGLNFNSVTSSFNGIDIGINSAPAFTDFDGDGILDLLIGDINGNIKHFRQTDAGSLIFTGDDLFSYIDVGEYSAPFITDLDNDGFVDILIGNSSGDVKRYEQYDNPDYHFNFYLLTGGFSGINVGYRSNPIVYDIDNDGLLDMLVGEDDGNINHYTQSIDNPESFYLVNSNFNAIDVGSHSAPCITDIDGDGLLDLLIGNWDGKMYHYEQGFENSLVFTLVSNHFNGIDVGYQAAPVFDDIDGNGLLDLLIGNSNGRIVYYKQQELNSNTFEWVSDQFESIDIGDDATPCLFDIDQNGLIELLIGENNNIVNLFTQIYADSTNFQYDGCLVDLTFGWYPNTAPFVTDLENDGILDLLIGVLGGNIMHYRQYDQYSSFGIVSSSICKGVNLFGANTKPCFFDINSNGQMDLLIGNSAGILAHYEQSLTNPILYELITESFNDIDVGSESAPAIADINENGLLDLLIGESDGIINYYEQNTENSYEFTLQVETLSGIDIGSYSTPILTDLDGDNLFDLLIGEQDGNINHFEQNDQNPLIFVEVSTTFNDIDVGNYSAPFITDIENNGLMDLLVGAGSGTISHYTQDEGNTTNFSLLNDAYGNIDIGSNAAPFAFDMIGDGVMELVVGENLGGLHLYLNYGTSCANLLSPENESTELQVNQTFTWSSAINADGYFVNLGTDNPPTNVLNLENVGSDTTYSPPSNLDYNQTYYWQVVPYNAVDTAADCTVYTFTTQTLLEIPVIETFTECSLPVGWSQESIGNNPPVWACTNSENAGGEACEMTANQSTGNGTSRLITPMINTVGLTELGMEFDHYFQDAGSFGLVLYIESSSDGINWTSESWNIISGTGNIGPEKVALNIGNNLGNHTYIAFTISGNHANLSSWSIDNIGFFDATLPPVCTTPITPEYEATDVSLLSALSWNQTGNTDGYKIYFGTDNPPTNIENGTDLGDINQYTPALTLDESTTYYWQIIPYNNNGDAEGCEVWSFQTLTLYPPQNLIATLNTPNVELEWDAPAVPEPDGDWLFWDNGTNNNGLGLGEGGTYQCAIRWDSDQLTAYNGSELFKFAFFPRKFQNESEFTFMIWEGANAANLVYEQEVSNLNWNAWNEITLDLDYFVDASTELWVGFEVTHVDAENPMGYDAGPAVAGYGDMISLDGTTWQSMSIAWNLNYNFNIRAFLSESGKGSSSRPTVILDRKTIPGNSHPVAGNLEKPLFPDFNQKQRSQYSFNVYRNDSLLTPNPIETLFYVDENVPVGMNIYTVKAVYTEGLSAPAGPVEVVVPYSMPTIYTDPISFTYDAIAGDFIQDTLNITNLGDAELSYGIAIEYSESKILNDALKLDYSGMNIRDMETYFLGGIDPILDQTNTYEQSMLATIANPIVEYVNNISPDQLRLNNTANPTPTPNVTDENVFRYDDGVNADAIGLTSGGTFEVSAYWPASEMRQYAGMKLSQLEIYINDVPTAAVIKIYDAGTATVPGALLHEETITVTGLSWNVIELSSEVDITGDDIWIGYEVTHDAGIYSAGCDGGPAVAGYGDMISLDGIAFESMAGLGLNCNWNIASTLIEGGPLPTNDVGVQAITQPISGADLSNAEPVEFTIKNYGTASQSNIDWEVTWDGPTGAGSANGTFAGPLASGTTASIDAGTADFSEPGVYTIEACANLIGDENPANNCKTKFVVHQSEEGWLTVDPLVGDLNLQEQLLHAININTPAETGTYEANIKITSNDPNNPEYIIPVELNVTVPLEAKFYADVTVGETPVEVQFTDATIGTSPPTSWQWDFDNDSVVDSYEQNPTATFTEQGSYSISLIVSNGLETDTLLKTNYITVQLPPTIQASPLSFTYDAIAGDFIQDSLSITNLGDAQLHYGIEIEYSESKNQIDGSKLDYCDASTSSNDEFIANVLCGSIDNSSTWQSGVADYTNISTAITAGQSEAITITNGQAYNTDMVSCWIDWNLNGIFDTGTNEEYPLLNVGGLGATFTGSIDVPVNVADGDYRMRVRMTYSTAPQPCGSSNYGEVEDYTIQVLGVNENDIALVSVISPESTGAFTSTEPVVFSIRNKGLDTQTNIPWEVTVDGPSGQETLNGTFSGTLALGEMTDIDAGIADFSEPGVYIIEACANLIDDENPANNCKTKFVVHQSEEGWLTVDPLVGDLNFQEQINHNISINVPYIDGLHTANIKITSNDPNNPVINIPVELNVFVPLEARFEADDTFGFPPFEVNFTDMSYGGPLTWEWDFDGDGVTDSYEQNPTWVYEDFGFYDVTLIITEDAEIDTLVKQNYIEVNFQHESIITSIQDIPDDQGGWVMVNFSKSIYDTDPLQEWGEMYNIEMNTGNGWFNVANVGAYASNFYAAQVHTPFDSSQYSNGLINFRVIAIMQEGNFASETAQGYSVDNLAPAAPENMDYELLANAITINWDNCPDRDFAYFAIYKSEVSGAFSETPYATSTQAAFADPLVEGEIAYYIVTATDFHGNESLPSDEIETVPAMRWALKEGWSGISSFINPADADLESMFADVESQLIILQNNNGMYWPGQNVNTLGNWNMGQGYQIKVAEDVNLSISGSRLENQNLGLAQSWNLMPVLSECPADVAELFNGTDVSIVKEVAGWRTYWPAFGINTLQVLEPGKAYFALMGEGAEIIFPECTPSNSPSRERTGTLPNEATGQWAGTPPPPGGGWVGVNPTAISHNIALPASANSNSILLAGDIIGVFDNAGNCYGLAEWNGSNTALTAFGNDPLTAAKDGFDQGETMVFKLYRMEDESEITLEVEFNYAMPQNAAFAENGLSAISGIKSGSTGFENQGQVQKSQIVPNPAHDAFTLMLDIAPQSTGKLELYNLKGQLMKQLTISGQSTKVEITDLSAGVYVVNILIDNQTMVEQLIKH